MTTLSENEKKVISVSEADLEPIAIEFEDMTPEQQEIVQAGDQIAGQFPTELSNDELGLWIIRRGSCWVPG